MNPRARSGAGERSAAWTGPRVRAVVVMCPSQQATGQFARKASGRGLAQALPLLVDDPPRQLLLGDVGVVGGRLRPGDARTSGVLREQLGLGAEDLQEPLVLAVLDEQAVHLHGADLAHPVRAADGLRLDR